MKAISELKSKQSVINRIYDIVSKNTKSVYSDNYWIAKTDLVSDLSDNGIEMDLQTCYYTQENRNKIWEYKAIIGRFSLDLRIIANLPDGIGGYYDLTVSIW